MVTLRATAEEHNTKLASALASYQYPEIREASCDECRVKVIRLIFRGALLYDRKVEKAMQYYFFAHFYFLLG